MFGLWLTIFILQWSLRPVTFPRNLFSLFSEAAVCRCSSKQVLLEILQYLQCWNLVLIKLQALCPAGMQRDFNLAPKETSTQVIPVKIPKFLGTAFFMEHRRWLLLSVWWWACADLMLIKNKICGMVYTKKGSKSVQRMFFTHY